MKLLLIVNMVLVKRNLVLFTNLLPTLEDQTIAVDHGHGVDVTYLDSVRHLTQCHIENSFRSWLVMDLVVSCFLGLKATSQIATRELFLFVL